MEDRHLARPGRAMLRSGFNGQKFRAGQPLLLNLYPQIFQL